MLWVRYQSMRTLLALLLLAGSAARAQSTVGSWFGYAVEARLAEAPVALVGEVQYRTHAFLSDFDQVSLRGGVQSPVLGRGTALGAFYQFTRLATGGDSLTTEHRLQQELRVPQRLGSVRLSYRLRAEERWVGAAAVQTRGRAAVSVTVPLTGDGQRRGSVFAATSAELFLRGPGRGERPVYDRTRLFGGAGVRLTDDVGLQGGVLAQVFDDETDWQVQVSVQQRVTL